MSLISNTPRAVLMAALLGAAAVPALAQAAPAKPMVAPLSTASDATDIHSYAKPKIARVTHVDLDLTADFAGKKMVGTAALDLKLAPGAKEVVLDSKGLVIKSITDAKGKALKWTLGPADPHLGAPLTVAARRAARVTVVVPWARWRGGGELGGVRSAVRYTPPSYS